MVYSLGLKQNILISYSNWTLFFETKTETEDNCNHEMRYLNISYSPLTYRLTYLVVKEIIVIGPGMPLVIKIYLVRQRETNGPFH